jgi:hypothetical protein
LYVARLKANWTAIANGGMASFPVVIGFDLHRKARNSR